jgi:hypothetical protein
MMICGSFCFLRVFSEVHFIMLILLGCVLHINVSFGTLSSRLHGLRHRACLGPVRQLPSRVTHTCVKFRIVTQFRDMIGLHRFQVLGAGGGGQWCVNVLRSALKAGYFLGKSAYPLSHVSPSVCRHESARLTVYTFAWKLILGDFYWKSVEKIQIWLESYNSIGQFT